MLDTNRSMGFRSSVTFSKEQPWETTVLLHEERRFIISWRYSKPGKPKWISNTFVVLGRFRTSKGCQIARNTQSRARLATNCYPSKIFENIRALKPWGPFLDRTAAAAYLVQVVVEETKYLHWALFGAADDDAVSSMLLIKDVRLREYLTLPLIFSEVCQE